MYGQVTYHDCSQPIEFLIDGETAWMSAQQMAVLFGRDQGRVDQLIVQTLQAAGPGESLMGPVNMGNTEAYNLEVVASVGLELEKRGTRAFLKWVERRQIEYRVCEVTEYPEPGILFCSTLGYSAPLEQGEICIRGDGRKLSLEIAGEIFGEIAPRPQQWSDLWRLLEMVGAWQHWRPCYDTSTPEKKRWSVQILRGGMNLECQGGDCFPLGFDLFLAMINQLLGGQLAKSPVPWMASLPDREEILQMAQELCDYFALSPQERVRDLVGRRSHDPILRSRVISEGPDLIVPLVEVCLADPHQDLYRVSQTILEIVLEQSPQRFLAALPQLTQIMPALIELLQTSTNIGKPILQLLSQMAEHDQRVIPTIRVALTNRRIWKIALQTLNDLSPPDVDWESLLSGLHRRTFSEFESPWDSGGGPLVARMLWRRAPQALSQALSDLQPALVPTKSRDIRREAIETLTVFAGLCADQVPQEIVDRAMLLLNSDVELRNELLQLVKARGAGLDFVPFLSQTLEAPDPIGRAHREALNLLLALGADRPPVRESLLRALQHATLHDQIAKALIATLPECAKFLIGPINQHLESGSVVLVSGAALVAVPLGLETVPSLMVALQDKDYHIRRAALNALGSFGREARRATDLLQSNLKNADLPEERIHSWVTLALVDFDLADQAVAFILPFKESDEQYLRHTAVTALARLGPLARNAAPALRSHKTNSVHLSELIQLALTRIESPN